MKYVVPGIDWEKLQATFGLMALGGLLSWGGAWALFRIELHPRHWSRPMLQEVAPTPTDELQQSARARMPNLTCPEFVLHGGWEALEQELREHPQSWQRYDRDGDGQPCEGQFQPGLFRLGPVE